MEFHPFLTPMSKFLNIFHQFDTRFKIWESMTRKVQKKIRIVHRNLIEFHK